MRVDTASCKPGSSSLIGETEKGLTRKTTMTVRPPPPASVCLKKVVVVYLVGYLLHGLNEAKASQQQVTVKLQDLHGFHQIVFSDNVLHTDPCPLILT